MTAISQVLRRVFRPVVPRWVTYVATEGIGNRLRIHYLVAAYALHRKIPMVLAWHKNHACGAEFDELFKVPADSLSIEDGRTLRNNFEKRGKHLIHRLNNDQGSRFSSIEDIPAFRMPVEFGEAFYPHAFTDNGRMLGSYREIVRQSLQPSSEVETKLSRLRAALPKHYVGVHVRRCDFLAVFPTQIRSTESYVRECERLLAERPDLVFYLACDDPSVVDEFKNRLPTVSQSRPAYKENWLTDQHGLTFNYGDRDTYEGAVSACVDIWMLAGASRIIGTPMSSFSAAAAFIGDRPLIFPTQ